MPAPPSRRRGEKIRDALNQVAFVCYGSTCKRIIPLTDASCICGLLRPDRCACSECGREYDPELVTQCQGCTHFLPHSNAGKMARVTAQSAKYADDLKEGKKDKTVKELLLSV